MIVSIDMQNMRFMHKHEKTRVVANLAFLECRHGQYNVDDTEAKSFLCTLTDMEMKMLYRNTTGGEVHFLGASLRAILADLVERMPTADVNAYELDVQAGLVQDGDQTGYQYVKGSMKPTVVQTLFPSGAKLDKAANEPLVAATKRARYRDTGVQAAPRPAVALQVTPRTATATPSANAAQRPVAAPRQGGVRDIIWKVADEMWAKIGSPKDQSIVLKLRKDIMVELENNHQVKRNTSSNELGNWMKNRLAN